ncbi:DUF3576 domain-containing protein [Sediminimonas sp.]|uniref:DUF3576 domain-containing protein n=1 Tax=Sediminimonas sp. TaxID=2823379 RepID=UPI0025DC1B74|nr:DUF3576 domain-containing protein [Sediminimonas sp.]
MTLYRKTRFITAGALALTLAACGGGNDGQMIPGDIEASNEEAMKANPRMGNSGESSLWDLLRKQNPDVTVAVNRYLWNASLDVLNFLPVESVDPFTGVIVFGYGTPPGGGRAYRGTVLIKDPALDARSLVVSLQTRGGPVDAATQRAVEDAILSRARQLRIAARKL